MKYFDSYLKTVGTFVIVFGAPYLLIKGFQEESMALYFIYVAVLAGIAGPIQLWIEKREK